MNKNNQILFNRASKKIAVVLIIAILIITGAILAFKIFGFKNILVSQSETAVSPADDQSAKKEAKNQPKTIIIPASYVNASGTVVSIDNIKKELTIKTDAKKTLTVAYNEKTAIYQMKNNLPEDKTEDDIIKGKIISVQYDSLNNTAVSIMIGGKWVKI